MHGGGRRAGKIVEQIKAWNPDIVAFAEFRGTSPSKSIAKNLSDAGYKHQLVGSQCRRTQVECSVSGEPI